MDDAEIEKLADTFVEERVQISGHSVKPIASAGFVVAHGGLSNSLSVPASAALRWSICLSVGAMVGHGLAAIPSAMLIKAAFGKLAGRAVRVLTFEDAAVLDWLWRNSQFDQTVDYHHVSTSHEQIRNIYKLTPGFDRDDLTGSLTMLERNGSIVRTPSNCWRLVEKVMIFA